MNVVEGDGMQFPKYDLDSVKASVRSWRGGDDTGWFSAPSCSVDYVIHIFSCDNATAEKIILDGLLKLDTESFSRRVSMWGDIADEYGLKIT